MTSGTSPGTEAEGRRGKGTEVATTDPDGGELAGDRGATHGRDARFASLARARRRMALTLTAVMLVVYFGFIALVAWGKETMGEEIVDGLSVGILLGVVTIIAVFVLTLFYARWANAHELELDENRRSAR